MLQNDAQLERLIDVKKMYHLFFSVRKKNYVLLSLFYEPFK